MLSLTDRSVTAFVKSAGQDRVERAIDGHWGLRIRMRDGRGVYVYRYRLGDGTLRSTVLGKVRVGESGMEVNEALAAFTEASKARKAGTDPLDAKTAKRTADVVERKARKATEKVEKLTIARLVHAYLDDPEIRKLRTYRQLVMRLEKHCLPLIGRLPAATISRDDVLRFRDACDKAGEAERNSRFHRLSAVWRWAMDRTEYARLLPFNPWRDVKANPKRERTRVLTEGELRRLMAWLPACPTPTRGALTLCLLTATRISNACRMRIEHIEGNRWTIPKEEYKTGEPHMVILSKQAMAVIDAYRHGRTEGWLFPAERKPSKAVTSEVVRKDFWKAGLGDAVPHDFRRSLRTWASERGVSIDVGERLLGHSKAGIRGVYDRARHNIPAGEVWQQWSDYLDSLTAGDNVVTIRSSRKV